MSTIEQKKGYPEPSVEDPLFCLAAEALSAAINGGIALAPVHIERAMMQAGLSRYKENAKLWQTLAAQGTLKGKAAVTIADPEDSGELDFLTPGRNGLYFDPQFYPATPLRSTNERVLSEYSSEYSAEQLDMLIASAAEQRGYRVHDAPSIDELPCETLPKEPVAFVPTNTQSLDQLVANTLNAQASEANEITEPPQSDISSTDSQESPLSSAQFIPRDPSSLTGRHRDAYDAWIRTKSRSDVAAALEVSVGTVDGYLVRLRKQGYLKPADRSASIKAAHARRKTLVASASELNSVDRQEVDDNTTSQAQLLEQVIQQQALPNSQNGSQDTISPLPQLSEKPISLREELEGLDRRIAELYDSGGTPKSISNDLLDESKGLLTADVVRGRLRALSQLGHITSAQKEARRDALRYIEEHINYVNPQAVSQLFPAVPLRFIELAISEVRDDKIDINTTRSFRPVTLLPTPPAEQSKPVHTNGVAPAQTGRRDALSPKAPEKLTLDISQFRSLAGEEVLDFLALFTNGPTREALRIISPRLVTREVPKNIRVALNNILAEGSRRLPRAKRIPLAGRFPQGDVNYAKSLVTIVKRGMLEASDIRERNDVLPVSNSQTQTRNAIVGWLFQELREYQKANGTK